MWPPLRRARRTEPVIERCDYLVFPEEKVTVIAGVGLPEPMYPPEHPCGKPAILKVKLLWRQSNYSFADVYCRDHALELLPKWLEIIEGLPE